jgi:hypothetical protein
MFPFDTINFIITLVIIAKVVSTLRRPVGCPNLSELEEALEDEG